MELKNNILNFKEEIKNFSIDELNNKKSELQDAISKMIMDSDMVLKIAIIEARLDELTKGK